MTKVILPDLRTDDFDFDLPLARIAQTPVEPRDHARLLHIPAQGAFQDRHVYDLPDLLRPDDVLVLNDTRVIPARLYGTRGVVPIEILLHKKEASGVWLAFARPAKRLKPDDTIVFSPTFSATVVGKHESGQVALRFSVPDDELSAQLHQHGEPPLPPYIKRPRGAAKQDLNRYQTVFAAREGAVAAPTAGLHFTPELLAKLDAKGISCVTVTLHVGAGTFMPVKEENIRNHIMHAEWGEITPEAANQINMAKRDKRRIVAVGTTSLRLLESAASADGFLLPFKNDTDIFIAPGYAFRAVDALLTNFHLPKSTLFMLVSAFIGMERARAAYATAIQRDYRFYSYGDTTLMERRGA